MTELISLSDIQEFKGLSSNIKTAKELTPHVLEAQEFDLRPFMGESFYLAFMDDFEASPSLGTPAFEELFNGKRYTYNGEQFEFQGLKAVLAYHSNARYLTTAGMTSTPTGFVNKTNQYSERISDKATLRLIEQSRAGAMVHQNRVKEFLNRFSSLYPLYKCGGGSKYRNGMKAKKIG